MGETCSCDCSRQPPAMVSSDGSAMIDANNAIDKFKNLIKKNFSNPGDAFKSLDRDDDKGVTKDEFLAAIADISKGWAMGDKVFMKNNGEFVFDELDVSKDGTLTYKEFKERLLHKIGDKADPLVKLRELLKKSYKDPKKAFSALDKDGDASLSPDEFKTMLLSCGKECGWPDEMRSFMKDHVDAIFASMDGNADGSVTLQEFKKKLVGH
eukprot:TRINITY_DN56737_c0_g1_i1.p1 TRINITY_DN56737_c0_g1~~TRINITY_DN56737_c0_g1_i1.p1  ORF type:complete len:210 (+),score=53.98 TRINITY_DN56737_c0_g1_i1:70-699(+)